MTRLDSETRSILRTAEWESLAPQQRARVAAALHRADVARDPGREEGEDRTAGQRAADALATFGGSWAFIVAFAAFLGAWVVINTDVLQPRQQAWDPYPYVFLNLILSMLAAIQAPIIMMSQNRAAERDRRQAQADYEVNLKAELEIRRLHDRLDFLREREWAELVAAQRRQIEMLEALLDLPATER